MISRYLVRLPYDVQCLVEDLERESGVEIEIQVDSSRASGSPDQPDPLLCAIDDYGARLILPTAEHFPEASVLHELLHIRRILLNGVAQIVICDDYLDPKLKQFVTALDNNIEHLVIVPEELDRRPERRDRWEAIMRRVLTEVQSYKFNCDLDRDCHALLGTAFIRHVLRDCELREEARAVMEPLGLNDRADRFFETIVPSLESKAGATRICFKHLGLSMQGVCLDYICIDRGQLTCVQIPLAQAA